MQLKKRSGGGLKLSPRRKKFLTYGIILAPVALLVVGPLIAVLAHQITGFSVIKELSYLPNRVYGLMSSPDTMTIDIAFEDYQQLAYKREMALADGILMSSDEDYVPASVTFKDQTTLSTGIAK